MHLEYRLLELTDSKNDTHTITSILWQNTIIDSGTVNGGERSPQEASQQIDCGFK